LTWYKDVIYYVYIKDMLSQYLNHIEMKKQNNHLRPKVSIPVRGGRFQYGPGIPEELP